MSGIVNHLEVCSYKQILSHLLHFIYLHFYGFRDPVPTWASKTWVSAGVLEHFPDPREVHIYIRLHISKARQVGSNS